MVNLFDDPNTIGDIRAPDALQPQKPASRSRAGPTRRSATDRTRQRAQNSAVARDTDQRESAPASVMARVEAAVIRSAEITKRVALAGASAIGLTLLLQNYEPARNALQERFELAPHIKQLTAAHWLSLSTSRRWAPRLRSNSTKTVPMPRILLISAG